MKLFAFGLGYSAAAAARRMAPAAVAGTTRAPEKAAALAAFADMRLFDGKSAGDGLRRALSGTSHLLIAIAPAEEEGAGDRVLGCLGGDIAALPELKSVVYLSSVGVYGDHGGAWVDEESPLRPASRRSRARLLAEAQWRAFGERTGVPVAILRLGGIYGPGRNAFVALAAGRARRIVKPGQVFNRVHVDDIAAAVELAFAKVAGGVFNIVDDAPAPAEDVVSYAAALMGVAPPPEEDFATADLTPMARRFYDENKRVSNARSREALGLAYAYCDYRAALAAMWRKNVWR